MATVNISPSGLIEETLSSENFSPLGLINEDSGSVFSLTGDNSSQANDSGTGSISIPGSGSGGGGGMGLGMGLGLSFVSAAASASAALIEYDSTVGLGVEADGTPILEKHASARYVYVNGDTGSDANDGLSAAQAKATLNAGKNLIRDNYGDWLLIADGTSYVEGFEADWNWERGLSVEYPTVVTTYDPASPTTLRQGSVTIGTAPTSTTIIIRVVDGKRIVFENINVHKTLVETESASVTLIEPRSEETPFNVLFYNCQFKGCSVTCQGDYSGSPVTFFVTDIIFRHCSFSYAHAPYPTHAQGFFAFNTNRLTIEDSIFYHNGWQTVRDDPGTGDDGLYPDVFKHNVYLGTANYNTVFRRNVSGHASSNGIQMRGGGTMKDNVFANNPINVLVGGGDNYDIWRPDGVPYTITGNVIVGAADLNSTSPRGWGLDISNSQDGGTASDNIIANVDDGLVTVAGQVHALRPYSNKLNKPAYFNWSNNVEYKWNHNYTTEDYTGESLQDQINEGSTYPEQVYVTRNNNVIHYEADSGTNTQEPSTAYFEPTRTITTYATDQGYADEDALWVDMIANPKRSWAWSIRNYMREGFNKS